MAVKLLRDEYAQDRSFISRFRAEAHHAAAVCRPGIASAFDYGQATTSDGAAPTAFLVMEPVDGEPLSALLAREGRLGLVRSLDIVGQAAVALGRRIGQGWCTATSSSQPADTSLFGHQLLGLRRGAGPPGPGRRLSGVTRRGTRDQ